MKEEDIIEKISIIEDPNQTITSRLSTEQLKIYRIRIVLFILLGFLLTFDLIRLGIIVHSYVDDSNFTHHFKNKFGLLTALLIFIFDAFGLIASHRYFQEGLRVFAWIETIILILLRATFLAFSILEFTEKSDDMIGAAVYGIILIISSITALVVICLSFKLSSLLANTRHPIIRTV